MPSPKCNTQPRTGDGLEMNRRWLEANDLTTIFGFRGRSLAACGDVHVPHGSDCSRHGQSIFWNKTGT
jgi:hypothetical protein